MYYLRLFSFFCSVFHSLLFPLVCLFVCFVFYPFLKVCLYYHFLLLLSASAQNCLVTFLFFRSLLFNLLFRFECHEKNVKNYILFSFILSLFNFFRLVLINFNVQAHPFCLKFLVLLLHSDVWNLITFSLVVFEKKYSSDYDHIYNKYISNCVILFYTSFWYLFYWIFPSF